MKTPCDYEPFICPYSNDPSKSTCDFYCSDTETYEGHAEEYDEEDYDG